jgi:hypothetical protein
MIGAALVALATLIGVVAPFEGRSFQLQGTSGYGLSALEGGGPLRNGDRNDAPSMEGIILANRLICNTKYQINGGNRFARRIQAPEPLFGWNVACLNVISRRLNQYNIIATGKDNICPGIIVCLDRFPNIVWQIFANRLKDVNAFSFTMERSKYFCDQAISGLKLCLSHNGYSGSSAGIFDRQSYIEDQSPIVIDQRSLDLWNDLEPRPLLISHFGDLPVRGIGLPLSLRSQFGQIADGVPYIRVVGGVAISEGSYEQRAKTDQKGQPFIDAEFEKKIAGWAIFVVSTVIGAVGAACLMGAQRGRDFDLSWRERVGYAFIGSIFFVIAAWLVAHVAAPMVSS